MGRNDREEQKALVQCAGGRQEFKLECQLETEIMEDNIAFLNLPGLTLLRKASGGRGGTDPWST